MCSENEGNRDERSKDPRDGPQPETPPSAVIILSGLDEGED